MATIVKPAAIALAALGLAACESGTSATGNMTGTGAAQSACRQALNDRNVVSPGDQPASVTGAEFSEAGSTIQLIDGDGTRWTCLASNDGVVEDLSIM